MATINSDSCDANINRCRTISVMNYIVEYKQADGTSKKLTFKSYADALRSANILVSADGSVKGHDPVSHVQVTTPYGLKEYIRNHPEGQDQLGSGQSHPAK